MSDYQYTLKPLGKTLLAGRRTILLFALGTMALALAVYLIWPPKYRAKVEFFLKNPMYADRSYLYNSNAQLIDYFASDEDIDRMKSLVWTDSIQNQIIRELKLDGAYGYDLSDPDEAKKLKRNFSKRVHIYRTESRVVILSYLDGDENRARAAASRCVELLERQLRSFYDETRATIYSTLQSKIREEDSSISALSDTLSLMRERYGIYDIISPARANILVSNLHDNGKIGFAKGIELIQNVEAIKDELVSDRSRLMTLARQYGTGSTLNTMPITQILRREQPPYKREGPGLVITILASGLAGAFFGILFLAAGYSLARGRINVA
jgi:hypothetical protein